MRSKTADRNFEQPERIKEKVGRCDYITFITQSPHGWHHQSRIKPRGGSISVGERRRVEGESAEREWSSWDKLDYLLPKKQHEMQKRLKRWEQGRVASDALDFILFFIQEDTFVISFSISSSNNRRHHPAAQLLSSTFTDVNRDDPHFARAALTRRKDTWKQRVTKQQRGSHRKYPVYFLWSLFFFWGHSALDVKPGVDS